MTENIRVKIKDLKKMYMTENNELKIHDCKYRSEKIGCVCNT